MSFGGRVVRGRFRGCLLGHACGDALGAAVEFLDRPRILERFGPDGIGSFEAWVNDAGIRLAAGSVTDDTQMSNATAEALIDAASAGSRGGVWHPAEFGWKRYIDWLDTQDDPFQRRYPGNTCLSALVAGRPGDMEDPVNDSKGSGGIMRVAPCGLAFAPDRAFEQGVEFAALTHGHPSGYLAAGFLADVISRLVHVSGRRAGKIVRGRGGPLPLAIEETREALLGYEDHDEVLEAVDEAVELYMSDVDLDAGLVAMGEGWVAEEALAIALFCALNFPDDLIEGVLAAVNITGDSDTTGCITGAVLGAMLGDSSVPHEWKSKVEGAGRITALADGLFDAYVASPEC